MSLTVIILTYNEEVHIARALKSVSAFAEKIYVIDSGSKDRTVEIAQSAGAVVLSQPWTNYATQFNWALEQIPNDAEWVLRLDADEYLTPELQREINEELSGFSREIVGVYVPRRMAFMGRLIKHGGVFPVKVIRLFRHGQAHCENRWMDEHIKVDGKTAILSGELIDDNLNPLSWWIDKHNAYASREVIDLLNLDYKFLPDDTIAELKSARQDAVKRWIKEKLYARAPAGLRAFVYFLYRYVFRAGFLDGRQGTAFHILQGFWYRYLVDMKLYEVKKYMRQQKVDAPVAIKRILSIDLDA